MSEAAPGGGPEHALAHPPEEVLLAFTRSVRAAGVPVTLDRAQSFVTAVAEVGLADEDAVFAAGRATLCGSPDDVRRYRQVFDAFFDPETGLPRTRTAPPATPVTATVDLGESGDGPGGDAAADDQDVVRAMASELEVLRHRDVASMTTAERARLAVLFAALRPRPPLRRVPRQEPWRRGRLDAGRTLRASLRQGGEPGRVHWRHPRRRPRRVVLLVDVSGSMSSYADALLRLAHAMTQGLAARGGRVETFTLGTRLTHVTRAMRTRDPERALAAVGEAVADWSGGTRLGETLAAFVDRWGRRGLARGAVVVLFSDGWERGDASLLGEQARRLRAVAHRVVWVNPHRGKTGYAPVQGGIVAVLPYVDDLVAGHSMATYDELVEVVARA